jgi:hypothetical protein
VPGTSLLILSFPLSSALGGGSRTGGLTNTVLEVEGVSVGGATYPRPVLSVWALLYGHHASQLFINDSF